MSASNHVPCDKCKEGSYDLARWPSIPNAPGTGGGTYWKCTKCGHTRDRLSDLRFESAMERDLWLRIFERDGLTAADAAVMALRERLVAPASLELAVGVERERWASRLRESFQGVQAQEKDMVEITGRPLEARMVSYFSGMREGIESAIRIIEHTPIGWMPPPPQRKP